MPFLFFVISVAMICATSSICVAKTPSPPNDSPGITTKWVKTTSGCKVASPIDKSEGFERAEWSGACVDGFGHGRGKLTITSNNLTYTHIGLLARGRLSVGVISERYVSSDGRMGLVICDTKREGICEGKTSALTPDKTFEGVFHGVSRTGVGKLTYTKTNEVYEGEVRNFIEHGKGQVRLGSMFYKGEYKDGVIDGYGEMTNGASRYVGNFKQGKYDGEGTLTIGKETWKGRFEQGALNGYGEHSVDSAWYKGSYQNNKKHGQGALNFGNGMEYQGEFKNDFPEGFGMLTYPDRRAFHGQFKDGFPIGRGILYDEDGDKYGVNIVDGKMHITHIFVGDRAVSVDEVGRESPLKKESGVDLIAKCLSMAGNTKSNMQRGNLGSYLADAGACSKDPDGFASFQQQRDERTAREQQQRETESDRQRDAERQRKSDMEAQLFSGVGMPGRDGGMVVGGPLNGSTLPGRQGGMVVGGPLDGSFFPGSSGGIITGGPLSGTIVPPRNRR
jgi:hypothetical protein